jgi:hypothetical protein
MDVTTSPTGSPKRWEDIPHEPPFHIDLSITLCNDVITDPPFLKPEITYQVHSETLPNWAISFPASPPSRPPTAPVLPPPNGCG